MFATVNRHNVRKGKPVRLREDLPPNFGNRTLIARTSYLGEVRVGHVTSNGFEQGVLSVLFPLYPEGNKNVKLNELSAARFLHTDINYS